MITTDRLQRIQSNCDEISKKEHKNAITIKQVHRIFDKLIEESIEDDKQRGEKNE